MLRRYGKIMYRNWKASKTIVLLILRCIAAVLQRMNVASLLFPANTMGLCRRGTTKTHRSQSMLIEQSLKDYEFLNGYLVAGGQKKVDEANTWF
jgi:hypothetical protein